MPWQFRVIDGGDQGRIFQVDPGIVTVGSSRKHADIALNDLYAARVHCELQVEADHAVVTAHDTPQGTLVNGQKVQTHTIRHGDVVRMGNSHLRFENVETAATEAPPEEEVADVAFEVLEEEEEELVETVAVSGAAAPGAAAPAVAAPAGAAADAKAHAPPGHRLAHLVGQTLAHFQIEATLGAGHCGMVFRARDLKTNQRVALKVLAADFPAPVAAPAQVDQEMRRFVQVYKFVLPLRHEHLVSVLGVGKTGPHCWLSTEWIDNTSVPEMIELTGRGANSPWQRPFRMLTQIARTLIFAHQQRLVHGNITARHVLWRHGDQTAKLADLGLSAALHGSALQRATWRRKLDEELAYLSPELTYPDCFVDGVCDIYSLGVVAYALFTGRFPCKGANSAETIRAIRETAPARPSQLQAGIPKRLDGILLRMLAKNQEDRYQEAEELVEDLARVGQQEHCEVEA